MPQQDIHDFLADVSKPPDDVAPFIFDVIATVCTVYLAGYGLVRGGGLGSWGPALNLLSQRFDLIDRRIVALSQSVVAVMDAIQQMPSIFNATFEQQYWEKRILEAEGRLVTIREMMADEAALEFNRTEFRPAIRELRNFLNTYELDFRNRPERKKLALSFLTAVAPIYTSAGILNDMFVAWVFSDPLISTDIYPEYEDFPGKNGQIPPSVLHTSWGTHGFLSGIYGKLLADFDQEKALNDPIARRLYPDETGPPKATPEVGKVAVYDFDGTNFFFSHYSGKNSRGVEPEGRNLGRVSGRYFRTSNGIFHWAGYGAYRGRSREKYIIFTDSNTDTALESAVGAIVSAREFFHKAADFEAKIDSFRDTHNALLNGTIFA